LIHDNGKKLKLNLTFEICNIPVPTCILTRAVEPEPKQFWMAGAVAVAGAGAKNVSMVEPKPEPEVWFPVPQP